ncbi:UPF0692 protein CG33108 [Eumeta japonica]|uniref:Actin maturation protease n=1 Tax=Eumeta variegata TaxID=151549 RepID=A0A4C1XW85_EUMVA|nr:UPF0692 protein CG33108 [Eumeta japonica]
MCSLPPPPPPLPQLLMARSYKKNETQTQYKCNQNEDNACEWASDFVELREACRKNKICMEIEPYKFVYRHFESILQIGPTCGLVALSMMLNGKVSIDELLRLAKAKGYSNNGHKAHWALVCGIIITKEPAITDAPTSNVYILCKHGKSRHLSVWRIDELAMSNENLWEFSPNREEDNVTYILPECGIGGENGLRSQFIVIEGL